MVEQLLHVHVNEGVGLTHNLEQAFIKGGKILLAGAALVLAAGAVLAYGELGHEQEPMISESEAVLPGQQG